LDLVSILDEPRRTKQVIREARTCFKALKRAYPSLWFQGVFELELVDFKALLAADGGQVKSKTIAHMLGWKDEWGTRALESQSTLVLVHCHVLIDLNGAGAVEVYNWLKNRYGRASRQVDVRRIRQDQSLDDLCWKIGSSVQRQGAVQHVLRNAGLQKR